MVPMNIPRVAPNPGHIGSPCPECTCNCMGLAPENSAPCGCDGCEVCDCLQRAYEEGEG